MSRKLRGKVIYGSARWGEILSVDHYGDSEETCRISTIVKLLTEEGMMSLSG